MQIDVAIHWSSTASVVRVEAANALLGSALVTRGQATFRDGQLDSDGGPCRLELRLTADSLGPGADPATVFIRTPDANRSFCFFLRDVRRDWPILIPAFGVAVTTADDPRSFEQIAADVRARGLLSNLQRTNAEPEDSWDRAAAETRSLQCPIWLGVSRDIRIFEFGVRHPMHVTDYIHPRLHGLDYYDQPDPDDKTRRYGYVAGRGWGCTERIRRWLDEDTLPIIHAERIDEDIRYETTGFVSMERAPLARGVRGTHWLVADGFCYAHSFTDAQQKQFESLKTAELNRDEETVFCGRITAVNTASVPRYAVFKSIHPVYGLYASPAEHRLDPETGFSSHPDSDKVFAVSKLDGRPMPQQEIAVLLQPGATCTYEFYLPHRPIPADRAAALAGRDFGQLLDDCQQFWKSKLAAAARIDLPEKRIQDMLRAGLLHLDVLTYGLEPDGILNGSNGTYSALGSETTINTGFLDSMNLPSMAARSLEFFLEKQQENGLMQNFVGYMAETGGVLWALGEHWRYTRDRQWLDRIKPRVIKACRFLLDGLAENRREDLRGRGYGMLPGRAADPVEEERIFFLNGYAYLGLARAAEMLQSADPEESRRIARQTEAFRADILTALREAIARGPVFPLADGTWCPTPGPWAGRFGPPCLFTDRGNWWSHGCMTIRDDALGPLHLPFQEVLDPADPTTDLLLNYYHELFYDRGFGLSQPYLGRQPWIHLRRRETKAFLKGYYSGVASLADRETYSWWEHYFHVSPHKTHEEAEFLMQTRWMLWLEEGDTLALLRGIPRAWLEDGKRIELNNAASYFGPFSLAVRSHLGRGFIEAQITCESDRRPRSVELRLPNPIGQRALSAEGGDYSPEHETVTIGGFTGRAAVRLHFGA